MNCITRTIALLFGVILTLGTSGCDTPSATKGTGENNNSSALNSSLKDDINKPPAQTTKDFNSSVSDPPPTPSPVATGDTKPTSDTKPTTQEEKVPDLAHVTLKNGKTLVYGSKTPRLLYFYHSTAEKKEPVLAKERNLFKKEATLYASNVVFLLVDLDDQEGGGEKFWRALWNTDPDLLPVMVIIWPAEQPPKKAQVPLPAITKDALEEVLAQMLKVEPMKLAKK